MRRLPLIALSGLLFGVVGCATISDMLAHPRTARGTNAIALAEPSSSAFMQSYVAPGVNNARFVPVAFEMRDGDTLFSVTSENSFGVVDTIGTFKGGAIIAREFQEAVAANFHLARQGEAPVAKIIVGVNRISVMKRTWSDEAETKISVQVQVKKPGDTSPGYSHEFSAFCQEAWQSQGEVPSAFYRAVAKVVEDFLADLGASGVPAIVLQWNDEATPGLTPPELATIDWTKEGDVWLGRCEVQCNDYEGFRTRTWAADQIFLACQVKLGNIEDARVRVVYDMAGFDGKTGKWTFVFRTFARSRMVLSFNKETGQGQVTGDLGLMNVRPDDGMGVERAVEELKAYVLSQMGSFAGAVSADVQKGEALVRFDDFITDRTYNLVTIKFRLL